MHHRVPEHPYLGGDRIGLDDRRVDSRCERRRGRRIVAGRLEAGLLTLEDGRHRHVGLGVRESRCAAGRIVEGVAERVRQHGHDTERDRGALGAGLGAHHAHVPLAQFEIGDVGVEMVRGDLLRLLRHHLRGDMEGGTGHHGTARGERADRVTESTGVAGDDLDVGDRHTEIVRNDLREGGLVPLA